MIMILIIFLLLSNAVISRRDLSILFNRITIIGFIYCILQNLLSFSILSNGVGLQGGLIYINNITQIFHIFIFILTILILQLTSFYPQKLYNINIVTKKLINLQAKFFEKAEHLKIIEYPLILLFVITGACLLISTNDLISIFLSIELQSYGLYLISTIYRNSELSTTSGLIYFLIGGLSSCFILLGISLLYVNSGTSNLDALYIINNITDLNDINIWYKPYYINFSLLLLSIGFLIKISAAPFHFWSPDVYDGLPTIVTVFVAIIAKISIFVLLFQLVHFTKNNLFELNWTFSLIISSFLSLIIGSILGLTQFRIKRLLAYSTISHLGFMLLALSISSIESIQAFIFYITQYSLSNLNIFIILITIGFSLYYYNNSNFEQIKLIDKKNSPIQLISQLKGYFYINPVLSLSLAITIFSFIGIPPLIGFFGKQMVLSAALDQGFIFLVLVAILTSVISAVYYLTLIKEIFFYSNEYKENTFLLKKLYKFNSNNLDNTRSHNIIISSPFAFTISFITLIILLFLFMNKEWLSMGTVLVQIIFEN